MVNILHDIKDVLYQILPDAVKEEGNRGWGEHATPAPVPGAYNFEELESVSNGDLEFMAEMIRIFLESMEKGLVNIHIGIATNNWSLVEQHARKVAIPSHHLGMRHLYDLLKQVGHHATKARTSIELRQCVTKLDQEAALIREALTVELQQLRQGDILEE